jgi:Domain of unknown function (DUF4868)
VTARETLDELKGFFAEHPDLDVATVARPAAGSGQHEARVLPLAGDAQAFFREMIGTVVIDRLPQWSLKRLDPVYKPEVGEVQWANVTEVDAIRLARDRYANLGPFQPFRPEDEQYKRRLLFWVCVLTGTHRRAYFFRAFSSASELQRKRRVAMVSKGGVFTKVDEHIFLFDDKIDCLVVGDYLFVLRKNDYRRIFDQLDEVREAARGAAEALHAKVPIANFAAFADACSSQAAMADKLLAIQKRDYFERLSYAMLEPVINEFALDIPVDRSNGAYQLVFRSEPEHRWRILRLIDDDYLKSSMTDTKYEVNSKSAPPG